MEPMERDEFVNHYSGSLYKLKRGDSSRFAEFDGGYRLPVS